MTVFAKPIKRLYTKEDEEMLTRAQLFHDTLTEELADFAAQFSWIDAAFLLSFQTDITTALNFQQDTAVVNMIKVLTEDVNASVEEGARALKVLNAFAVVAFPDSPAKQRVFGQDKWEKARNDQQKMSKALKLAYEFANAAPYNAALKAPGVGMTQAAIDSLDTIAENIDLKDKLQEMAASGRTITTEDRINVLNIVYRRKQLISNCSDVVWMNDAARREQYLLSPSQAGSGNTVIREITVPAGGIGNFNLAGITLTASSTVILDFAAEGRLYFSVSPTAAPGATFWDAPAGTQTKPIDEFKTLTGFDLLPGEQFLNVQNNALVTIIYKITITGLA